VKTTLSRSIAAATLVGVGVAAAFAGANLRAPPLRGAIYDYLRTIKPIKNAVPAPVPPKGAK